MQAVQSEYATLPHTSPSSDFQALAAYVAKRREFSSAQATATGVSGVFTDGRLFLFTANTLASSNAPAPAVVRPFGSASRASTLPTENGAAPNVPRRANTEFPTGGAVRVLVNKLDTKVFDATFANAIASGLTQAGYSGAVVQDSTIDSFAALKDVSLLLVETHGGIGYIPNGSPAPLPPGTMYFAVVTSTPVSPADDAKYAAGLASNAIGYHIGAYFVPTGNTELYNAESTYFITKNFFAQNVTFAPNSDDVFIGEFCDGGSSAQGVTDFVNELHTLGVSHYLGWTKNVLVQDMEESGAYLFDRMLGEQNQHDLLGFTFAPPGGGLQRPFDENSVLTAMSTIARRDGFSGTLTQSGNNASRGLIYLSIDLENDALPPTGSEVSNLVDYPATAYDTGAITPLVLAPSIEYMYVTEPYSEGSSDSTATLHLAGEFGSLPGKVVLQPGGSGPEQTLSSPAWSPFGINVTIPPTGASANGIVTVIAANGIRSNGVPLTQWSGTIGITDVQNISEDNGYSGNGSVTYGATLNVQIRADVHPLRPTVDALPVAQDFAFDDVMQSSTGSFTKAQGSFTATNGSTFSYAPSVPVALYPNTAGRGVENSFVLPFVDSDQGCTTGQNAHSGLPDCSFLTVNASVVAQCTTNPEGSDLCPDTGVSGPIAGAFSTVLDAPFQFALSGSYGIVTAPSVSFPDTLGGTLQGSTGTTTYKSGFGAPVSPPQANTPG
jgi:hypothetical protein